MLKIKGLTVQYQEGIKVKDLVRSYKPEADLYIVNSYPLCWSLRPGWIW